MILICKKFFYFWKKSKTIEKLFFYILNYSFLLPPVVFLLSFKKFPRYSKWIHTAVVITVYCAIFFILLLLADYFSDHFRKEYNTLYTTFEYFFFTYLIWTVIINRKFKIVIIFFSFLFLAFQCYFLLTTKTKSLDSIPIGIETILILTYIVYSFFEQFKNNDSQFIYHNYWFWIMIGILSYLSWTFFFNILASSIDYKTLKPYWFITYIFEIVKNVFFAIAVVILSKLSFASSEKKQAEIPNLDMI